MTDHLQHRCAESECCYTGQPSPKGCGCHQTREQMASACIERLEAKVGAVTRHIPMDYLQRHDKAGATGPTDALNLEAAMKDYSEDRWKAVDRIKTLRAINAELLEALTDARLTFAQYAEMHDAKGTAEGRMKAKRNRDLAARMMDAIAHAGEAGNGAS